MFSLSIILVVGEKRTVAFPPRAYPKKAQHVHSPEAYLISSFFIHKT